MSAPSLVASDGARSRELIGTQHGHGVFCLDLDLPLPGFANVYAEGSEGRRRIGSRPSNREGGTIALRVVAPSDSEVVGHEALYGSASDRAERFEWLLDDLEELVVSMREYGGTLTYTPPDGTAVTLDVEDIRVEGIPQGRERAHGRAMPTIGFECRPYARSSGVVVAAAETFDGPIAGLTVEDVPGQVDALGELVLTEASSESRGLVEVGVQSNFDSDNPEPLSLDGTELVVSGYAGAANGSPPAGAVSATTVALDLDSAPLAACSTGAQPHGGTWRPRVRVHGTDETHVRFAYRIGDGPVVRDLPWVSPASTGDWYALDVDPLRLSENGETWEGFIEAYGSGTLNVDLVEFVPGERWGRAKAPFVAGIATSFVVRDPFNHASGNLSGKTPPIGPGNWAEEVGTNFTCNGATITRATTSDGATNYHRGYVLGATYTDLVVEGFFKFSAYAPAGAGAGGGGIGFGKRIDGSNFIMAAAAIQDSADECLFVFTRGAVDPHPDEISYPFQKDTLYRVRVAFNASGAIQAWVAPDGAPFTTTPQLSAIGEDYASGGSHGAGYVSVLDIWREATANTRTLDNVTAYEPSPATVCYADQGMRFAHDAAYRDSEDGSAEGRVPEFEGKHLLLPPTTRAGRASRLVVRSRRYAPGYPDAGLGDSLEGDLSAVPRALLTRR